MLNVVDGCIPSDQADDVEEERRFVLIDFTYMNRAGCLRLYEAGHTHDN
jgi:hypothetical protein